MVIWTAPPSSSPSPPFPSSSTPPPPSPSPPPPLPPPPLSPPSPPAPPPPPPPASPPPPIYVGFQLNQTDILKFRTPGRTDGQSHLLSVSALASSDILPPSAEECLSLYIIRSQLTVEENK